MGRFSDTLNEIKHDFPDGKVSVKFFLKNFFFSPGFRVLLNYRIGKYFYFSNSFIFKRVAEFYKYQLVVKRSCQISYKAILNKNIKLPHPIGIVIGEGVVINDDVMIFQQVTFGSHGRKGIKLEYPTIEKGVKIYAGAKIIGGIIIGENSIIGANAVVNIDIPPNSIAVGIPCKIIEK